MLRECEPQSVGFESSQAITDVANEFLGRLPKNDIHNPDYVAVNTALDHLKRDIIDPRWPDVRNKDMSFDEEEMKRSPHFFEKLNTFIAAAKGDPDLLRTVSDLEFMAETLFNDLRGTAIKLHLEVHMLATLLYIKTQGGLIISLFLEGETI